MDQSSNLRDKIVDTKYHREHLIQYGLLLVIFAFSLFLLVQINNVFTRLLIITVLALVYLGWGIWHHFEEKNLTTSHVLEYSVVAALIFTVLSFVFLI